MKILYVVDYLHNEANSVGDILARIIHNRAFSKNEQIIYKASGLFDKLSVTYVDGHKTYCFIQPKQRFWMRKWQTLKGYLHHILHLLKMDSCSKERHRIIQFKRVLGRERPDAVIFFVYNPEPQMTNYVNHGGGILLPV